jgi:hypothetical protein
MCKAFVKNSLLVSLYSLDMTMANTFFQLLKLNVSSISHQQAVAEHWDLPNTEIV